MKIKVLFVCVHNSARSQMAEDFLKEYGGEEYFAVESAGLEPGVLNPLVVKAMAEEGMDISNNSVNSAFEFFKEGRTYHYVISVCEEGRQKCPIFPSVFQTLYWSFEDPSGFLGSEEEKLSKVREVREQIKGKIREFVNLVVNHDYQLPAKELTLKL